MSIKVGGPKGSSGIDSKKKVNKGAKTEGPSFASFLQETEQTEGVKSVDSALQRPVAHVPLLEDAPSDTVPQDAHERGNYMLHQLETLEQDILSGNPTLAAQRLKTALQTAAHSTDTVSEDHQKILDEIDMRASIELAKFEK